MYFADSLLAIINQNRGDVFVFNKNGKIRTQFNHKGKSGLEYIRITSIAFDEKREELFILDLQKNTILVYSLEGLFKRSFRTPPKSFIKEIYHFDDSILLCYSEYREDWGLDEINQKMPYIYLSKEDGQVLSRVEISFLKRISDRIPIYEDGKMVGMMTLSTGGRNCKFGREFVISDKSSDTIYSLLPNKNLLPMLVRTPSVHHTNPLITLTVNLKTDRFLFLTIAVLDFNMAKNTKSYPVYGLVYDFQNRQIYRPVIRNADNPSRETNISPLFNVDVPQNTSAQLIDSDRLVELLGEGKLYGNLKQVAQALEEEDNPVLMLIKFK